MECPLYYYCMPKTPERWLLTWESAEHAVEIDDAGLGRRITWTIDGEEIATTKTSDDKVVLDGHERGAIAVRLPTFIGPARRVTWWDGDTELGAAAAALTGIGGVDLDPEPGSKAAVREEWIRAHPRKYAAQRTAVAVAGVAVPLIMLWLLAQIPIPEIDWPDWDINIPWPDFPWPDIPWPTISLPEFSLFDFTVPEWVKAVADKAKYVWPVVLAAVLANREVARRRRQDERKRQTDDPPTDSED